MGINIFNRKKDKYKVGRPKLAKRTLLKAAKIELALALVLCATMILSSISVLTGRSPLDLIYSTIKENFAGAVQLDRQFVIEPQPGGLCYKIYLPKEAGKNWRIHIFYKNSNKSLFGITPSLALEGRDLGETSSQIVCFEKKDNATNIQTARILLRWTKSGNNLVQTNPNYKTWKPDNWEYNNLLGWAYKDYEINWANATTTTTRTSTTTTTTTKPVTTVIKNEKLKCPSLEYVEGTKMVIIKVVPQNSNKWSFYSNKTNSTGFFGKWKEELSDQESMKQITLEYANFKRQGKIVVKNKNGFKKTCYTKVFNKLETTTKQKTIVSLNVSGTETRQVGYSAGPIVASTNPSSATITWTTSNKAVVQVIILDTKKIKIKVVGVGTANISATTDDGSKATFTIIGKGNTAVQTVTTTNSGYLYKAVNGFDSAVSTTINGIKVYVEKGCNASNITKYKTLVKTFPNYLSKAKEIYFLGDKSMINNFSSDGVSMPLGVANSAGYIAMSCSSYSSSGLVHEAAHIWDSYYSRTTGTGRISETNDYLMAFNYYKNLYKNGRMYFNKGAYIKGDGVYRDIANEFFPASYVVYYNSKITKLDISNNSSYNVSIPSPTDTSLNMINLIQKYIQKTNDLDN
ncbi:MAG TPA: hypothetical protein PKY25_02485 [Bacilli bacterium]|nr:hypothetical protein [Bacilli bacterium]